MEFSINVSDKESMIRCYDQQTSELQVQIDRLNDQLSGMCPLSQLTEARRQLAEAITKKESVERENSELQQLLGRANSANQNNQLKIQVIADKYLAIIKKLKVDISDFKKVALDQIKNTKEEIKNQMVAQLQAGIAQQIKRDEILQRQFVERQSQAERSAAYDRSNSGLRTGHLTRPHNIEKEEGSTRFTYEAVKKPRKRSSSNGTRSNHSSQHSTILSNKVARPKTAKQKKADEKLFTTVRNTTVPKNIGTASTGSSKFATKELATRELNVSDDSLQQADNASYLNDHQFLLSDGAGKNNSTTSDIYIQH